MKKKYVNVWVVIVGLMIALQVFRMVYSFAYEKEGTHSDEIWQYGLANSSTGPHLFWDFEKGEDRYYNEWITGDTFKEYITVSDDEKFTYGRVIENMKLDTAPPLYSLILHTICSFFPNTFSLWYGFIINLVFFVITMIFVYRLMLEFSGKRVLALTLVALLGFSIGMLDQMMFVRHYALLTMLTVMFTYYHLKLIKGEGRLFRNTLIKLAFITFFGALTHYFFTVYAFGMAAMYFLYYALKKAPRKLLAYSLILLISVMLTLPLTNLAGVVSDNTETASIGTLDNGEPTVLAAGIIDAGMGAVSSVINIIYDVRFDDSANEVMRCFSSDLFGLTFEWHVPYLIWHGLFVLAVLGVVFLLVAVVCHKKIEEGKEKTIYVKLNKIYIRLSNIGISKFFVASILIAIALEVYIVIGFAHPWIMNVATNRYLFLVYPMVYFILLIILHKIFSKCLEKIGKSKLVDMAMVSIVLAILVINNLFASCIYYYKSESEDRMILKDVVKGSDCILSSSIHWLIIPYSDKLYTAEDVFITSFSEMDTQVEKMSEADTKTVYWIQDVDRFEYMYTLNNDCTNHEVERKDVEFRYINTIKGAFPDAEVKYLFKDRIFTRDIYVYEIKR